MFIARFALQIEHSEHAPRTAASLVEVSSYMQVIHACCPHKGTALPGSAGAGQDEHGSAEASLIAACQALQHHLTPNSNHPGRSRSARHSIGGRDGRVLEFRRAQLQHACLVPRASLAGRGACACAHSASRQRRAEAGRKHRKKQATSFRPGFAINLSQPPVQPQPSGALLCFCLRMPPHDRTPSAASRTPDGPHSPGRLPVALLDDHLPVAHCP